MEVTYNTMPEAIMELVAQNKQILNRLAKIEESSLISEELPAKIPAKQVQTLFGISSPTLWSWGKKKILIPEKTPTGRKYYDKKDVMNLLQKVA